MARVHKHVVPYLPEQRYNDRWYYVTATLFGALPQHREEWHDLPNGKRMRVRTLGKAFRQLREKSDSMAARFVALLNAHPDDLDDHLRHAVSLLKANEQPLDWFCLLDDLLQWDHQEGRVQLKWARDFYKSNNSSGGDTSQASTTSEKKEIESHE
jgi:CRISPR system Cascade subunit CasB